MKIYKWAIVMLFITACSGRSETMKRTEVVLNKDTHVVDNSVVKVEDTAKIRLESSDLGSKIKINEPDDFAQKAQSTKLVIPKVSNTAESTSVKTDKPTQIVIDSVLPEQDEEVKTQPNVVIENEQSPNSIVQPDHRKFDQLLAKYVSKSGFVNYSGLKKDELLLDNYLDELKDHFISSEWDRNEKMAYWINAYNAFTLKLIVKNFPLNSILDLHKGKPWDVKWIELNGKKYSLNQIENDILRPEYKDPRIHFALNCAASSCPKLLNKAWIADNLSSNLERQTRAFINNTKENQLAPNEIRVSKIFDWYSEDFSDLIAFLNKYSELKISSDASINFNEYSWKLNGN